MTRRRGSSMPTVGSFVSGSHLRGGGDQDRRRQLLCRLPVGVPGGPLRACHHCCGCARDKSRSAAPNRGGRRDPRRRDCRDGRRLRRQRGQPGRPDLRSSRRRRGPRQRHRARPDSDVIRGDLRSTRPKAPQGNRRADSRLCGCAGWNGRGRRTRDLAASAGRQPCRPGKPSASDRARGHRIGIGHRRGCCTCDERPRRGSSAECKPGSPGCVLGDRPCPDSIRHPSDANPMEFASAGTLCRGPDNRSG